MISVLSIEDSEACGRSPTFIIWSKHESSITGLLTLLGGLSPILISSSLDGTCKVRELLSGRLLQTQVLSVAINAITINNDERLLFSGGDDGAIYATKLNIGLQEDQAAVSKDDAGVLSGHK
ncbi:uncharacterized protein LOC109725458 [Ananas comosus]|uniref:Uncharacterized protein LOC109725458 n=2 Tax=Ananas comosus TaxID=4615 RepID=A0A6P5GQR4_ANACO|nr:uncharacterized protein LOC109725458 [Ananas comosus]